MRLRLAFSIALTSTAAIGMAAPARASQIVPGDLIVVDRGNGSLDDVNPTTGASFVVASGFSNPQGVAINAVGTIFVSDIGTSTIDSVNPANGIVATFSGNGVGTGPTLNRPFQIVFRSGALDVAEGGVPNGNSTAVYTVVSNGDRTLMAGNNGSSNNLFGEFLAGLAVDSSGNIFAAAPTASTVYHVGPGTGTSLTTAISAPQGLAFGASGQLLAVNGNPSNPSIGSIDPTNGSATTLSDNNGTGSGPAYGVLRGITFGNGLIYATDLGNNEIFAVNPSTGNRTIVSGNGVGGTTFGSLTYGIAVYPTPVPEPASATLFILCAGGLLLFKQGKWLTRLVN